MKSRASGYLPFVTALFEDAGRICHASKVDVKRDIETIRHRVEHEGLSFLTITLPEFGKAFDHALAEERLDLSLFSGMKTVRRLPAFLRGFVCRVFDINTGGLLDEPSIDCIRAVRQIAYSFKKIRLPCSRSREQKAIDGYVEVERSLENPVFDSDELDSFSKVSVLLWGNAFSDFDHHQLTPKHGPGAVVEKYTPNQKYTNRQWHSRLEPFFPSDAYLYVNASHVLEEEIELSVVQEDQEQPVKVTLVPKTLKSPRIIAIEPCCMQYAQQAMSAYLVDRLESYWLTRRHVNFRDQSINQSLAMSASRSGLLATLDMSDASDRVSLSLVRHMLQSAPILLEALEACRSKAARLPSGEVIHLKKFASMGSAVCFPIEAMVFYTIIVSSLLREQKLPVTLRNIYKVSRRVWVYGDDIIVPTDMATAVVNSLTLLGNKVNSSKSFLSGGFRESCGVDAYRGNLVTPVYVRSTWPHDRGDASEIMSLVSTANQMYLKGYYTSLQWIKLSVERVVGPLPSVQETCSGLGWLHPFNVPRSLRRFNRKYQVQQVLTWVPGPVYRNDTLNGWAALLKFLIRTGYNGTCRKSSTSPSFGPHWLSRPMGQDGRHLERSPRHGASGMKRRWVTPY